MKSNDSSIPELVLVTGFLGSGKTTFLKNLLNESVGLRTGIIVNDFGSVAIDSRVLRSDAYYVDEIAGGSIFCVCKEGEFIQALRSMLVSSPEMIFVETSGMSDPSNIERLLPLAGNVSYSRSYCIVDAGNYIALKEVFPVLERQIVSSDIVIINKVDLVTDKDTERVRQEIIRLTEAPIYEAAHGVTLPIAEHKKCSRYSGVSSNSISNRPKSLVLNWEGEVDREKLRGFLEEMKSHILRIKGFCRTEKGIVLVSVTTSSVEVEPAVSNDITGLSLIARRETPIIKTLKNCWKAFFDKELRIS